MVLKTVWRFIDIVIGYFVIYLSSLLIKILQIHITSEATRGVYGQLADGPTRRHQLADV